MAKKKVPSKKAVKQSIPAKPPIKKEAARKGAAPKKKSAVKKKPVKGAVPKSTASGPVTTVIAQADVGWGNHIYLRGEGGGLSWEKGVMMDCREGNEWVWSTNSAASIPSSWETTPTCRPAESARSSIQSSVIRDRPCRG